MQSRNESNIRGIDVSETWKDIEGFEGIYMVSNLGRVKSLDRVITCIKNGKRTRQKLKGRTLVNRQDTAGYYAVVLCKNGKEKTHRVHRLVATAFIPNPDNKREVNHIDGDKTYNRVDNLEWNTSSENLKHAIDTGLYVHKTKLSDSDVEFIKKNYVPFSPKFGGVALAKKFGVTKDHVSRILNGKYRSKVRGNQRAIAQS